MAIKRFMRGE